MKIDYSENMNKTRKCTISEKNMYQIFHKISDQFSPISETSVPKISIEIFEKLQKLIRPIFNTIDRSRWFFQKNITQRQQKNSDSFLQFNQYDLILASD